MLTRRERANTNTPLMLYIKPMITVIASTVTGV